MDLNANKIIRTICYFTDNPTPKTFALLDKIGEPLLAAGYEIQTKRVCSSSIKKIKELDLKFTDESHCFAVGTLDVEEVRAQLDGLLATKDVSFNIDLTQKRIEQADAQILFEIIEREPRKTANFAYVFNNEPQTPFFPSASYQRDGFSIGLQPTDLSEDCQTLDEWLSKLKSAWDEIFEICKKDGGFLGIDSSIAPLFREKGSLVNFIKRLGFDFSQSVTTDTYLKVTNFIKGYNPKPVGLCGLMFPCLEDFELADEYEKGNFSIERNVYLALHSGLGIDTYPIGIDERPEMVLGVLNLVQGLSNKYKKPLSVRFVSDGRAKVGENSDFKISYLRDVVVKAL